MISNSDFEKAWFLYKTEYEPQNISINDFCFRKGLPYKEFNKWFRKTHKQVVSVEGEDAPEDQTEKPVVGGVAVSSVSRVSGVKNGGIQIFIRTHDGLQVQKKGLTYQGLLKLVEKLEGLC